MLITFKERGGMVVADADAYDVMLEIVRDGSDVVVSSDSLILALRMLIAEGIVHAREVFAMYDGYVIEFDVCGNIIGDWPDGFADTISQLTSDLFHTQLAKRLRYGSE